MQHLQPETTLQGGKYKIVRVLGQGGFGITYLAKYASNGRKVAIKELFVAPKGQAINGRNGNEVVVTNLSNQEQFEKHKEKFKKEAQRLAQYHHPNIVKVSEYFEENGTSYYVMAYIEGESLRNKLVREGALPEPLVMNYLGQILSALQVIHRDKIWHLDIKPENIMVDAEDKIYLIDFGASKHIVQGGTLTTSSMMAYTPGYYPPEQLSSTMRNIGAWSDIYSLGATIYNLLTQKNPPTFDAIFSEGKNAFSFTSKISSYTRDLIIKMMNPNRKERLQSVFEVKEFLNKEEKQKDELKRQQEVTIVEKPRQEKHEGTSIERSRDIYLQGNIPSDAIYATDRRLKFVDEGKDIDIMYIKSGFSYQKYTGCIYSNRAHCEFTFVDGFLKNICVFHYNKQLGAKYVLGYEGKKDSEYYYDENGYEISQESWESKYKLLNDELESALNPIAEEVHRTKKDVDFWEDCYNPAVFITAGLFFIYVVAASIFDWPTPDSSDGFFSKHNMPFIIIYGVFGSLLCFVMYMNKKDN